MGFKLNSMLIIILCFSLVSGVFAAEKTSDDMNDFSHFTIASQATYAVSWNLFRFYGAIIPSDLNTLDDVANYFNSLDQRANQKQLRPAYVVNVTPDELSPGDLVHVKNSDFPFMIYKGYNNVIKDNETDVIILESLLGRYTCTPDNFNEIFDGYAVKFPVTSEETNFAVSHNVNGSNVTDDPIYDPNSDSPCRIGDSLYVSFWEKHQFDSNSTDTAQLADFYDKNLNSDYTTDMKKAKAIFTWVKNNVDYSGKYVGTTWYSSFAIASNEAGNSCDQARLVYALGKIAGLNVMFHKAYCQFPSGQFAHVWTDIQVNGTWLSADTTSNQNMLGNTTYSQIITDYGQYDMLDC